MWHFFFCFCFCSAFARAGSRGGGCGNSSFVFVSAMRFRQQALGEVGVAILCLLLFLQCVCDSRLSGRWVWQFFVCFCFCSAFATAGSRGGECGTSSFVFVSAVRLREQALGEVGVAILRLFLFLRCVCDSRLSGRWVCSPANFQSRQGLYHTASVDSLLFLLGGFGPAHRCIGVAPVLLPLLRPKQVDSQ